MQEAVLMVLESKVLTVGDLSNYLRVHRSTVYRLLKQHRLPAFKVGSDWRFSIEAIDQWRLRQSTMEPERENPQMMSS
jgi:excisionase family DNA binding protein